MTGDAIEWTIRYNATFHTTLLRFLMPSIRAEGVPAFIVGWVIFYCEASVVIAGADNLDVQNWFHRTVSPATIPHYIRRIKRIPLKIHTRCAYMSMFLP